MDADAAAHSGMFEKPMVEEGSQRAALGVRPRCVEKWGPSVNVRGVPCFIVSTEADMLLSPSPSPLLGVFIPP